MVTVANKGHCEVSTKITLRFQYVICGVGGQRGQQALSQVASGCHQTQNSDLSRLLCSLTRLNMIPMSADLAWYPVPEILTNQWDMAQQIKDIYYFPEEADSICAEGFLMCWIKFTVRNQESFYLGSLM